MKLLTDLADLMFPRHCGSCSQRLYRWENGICMRCLMEIPLSQHHLDSENPVMQVFWGRVLIHQASTWFIYKNGSKFGNLLHRLKYEGWPRLGIAMGKQYGYELLNSGCWEIPDLIIPVPLHPKRKRKRGYNQSEMIARGLSIALEIPVETRVLLRKVNTKTQTAKTRADRFLNVSGKFEVGDSQKMEGKHVLLVDDVITTGATIEACAEELLKVTDIKVSVLALAFAEKRG